MFSLYSRVCRRLQQVTFSPAVDDRDKRTSILKELTNKPGALHEVLKYFWK
jgi:prephenate dehydratase